MDPLQQVKQAIQNNNLDEALDAHGQIRSVDNRVLDVERLLCAALLQAGRKSEAEMIARGAVALQPNNSAAYSLLGSILKAEEKYLDASQAFGTVYHWTPTDKEATYNYASILRRLGKESEAGDIEDEHRRLVEQSIEHLPCWQGQERDSRRESSTSRARQLYLDLLERIVANFIYQDGWIGAGSIQNFDLRRREMGKDIPTVAHTMVGLKRLRQIREAACRVIEDGIPGDFLEAGVWRGGVCILLRGVLEAYGDRTRKVWVADSFEGVPPPDPRFPKDAATRFNFHTRPELSVSLETVKENFQRYGLLDEQVVFLKGLFRESLPKIGDVQISILRIDGDLYSSTMDVLQQLYRKVSERGFVVIDDYGPVIDARRATLDFRVGNHIKDQMYAIDDDGVVWRKEEYGRSDWIRRKIRWFDFLSSIMSRGQR